MSYLFVCLIWSEKTVGLCSRWASGGHPPAGPQPSRCVGKLTCRQREHRGKGTLLLIVLAPSPAPLEVLVGPHARVMCSMIGFPCVSVCVSVCECVCECVCVCETESACVGICVQQRRGPSRTSTRAPAPAGSGEMKPQPWFSPRGFHWGRNLFSWGRKPACPELSTLDSLSSANSYCEVNVQRSGQFYV